MTSATGSDLRALFAPALIAALFAASAPARADVPATDKAAAEALFDHAKSLMKEGRYPEACLKFQESQRIDPGIGTMLYLADCFEKNGQAASAWAGFLEAAAAAKAAGQAEREKKARDRAAALEPRLTRLSITVVPGGEVPGLEVKRDGRPVSKALWGTPVPLDPGEHVVEATAPGKKPWSQTVKLDPASLIATSVVIPTLEAAPKAAPVVVESPRVDGPKGVALRVDPVKPATPRVKSGPIVTTRDKMSPLRIVGHSFFGVGLASAAVGGLLGMVTLLKKSDAADNCHANGVCGASGADAMNTAISLSRGANVTLIAGAVSFTTGLVIMLATNPVGADTQVVRVGPLVGSGSGGVVVGGAF